MKKNLLIGAGDSRVKKVGTHPDDHDWDGEVVTLDIDSAHSPDIVADLEELPYSWAKDEEYDEIHAYEVLEHTGSQGDWKFFFDQFSEFYRILKPKGRIVATVPAWDSMWAFGDPGHKRVINIGTLVFLSQREYEMQVGKTPMADYRFYYKANFEVIGHDIGPDHFMFVLEKQ